MLVAPSLPAARLRTARPGWRGVALGVAALAFLARLVPVLRGGGLTGLGNYDDGVYYAAGTALAHGRLPYADFLLLHPPGIVLALAPFGLLARLTGDPTGLAAARLAWMALGALNAVLVARVLRPRGLGPAALGGVAYALAYPALYTEWTPLLEAPASTCVLLALQLLGPAGETPQQGRAPAWLPLAAAGALVGLSATFKIWGAATVVAVVGWYALRGRWRASVRVLAGAAASVTVVCLPFFVAAPGPMWRMVVLDQLGRGRSGTALVPRLAGVVGLGLQRPPVRGLTPLLVLVLVLVTALVAVAAVAVPTARPAVVLSVVHTAVLLAGPSWFLHYPALVWGPLVIAVVAGASELARRLTGAHPALGGGLLVVLGVAVVVQALPLAHLRLGAPFPGARLGRAAGATHGCVTSDDPAALAAMGVLGRDLASGCPFIADLSGYSYDLARQRGAAVPRQADEQWQQIYRDQLRTGTATLPFRYAPVLSPSTRTTVQTWPVLARVGPYVLRRPTGA